MNFIEDNSIDDNLNKDLNFSRIAKIKTDFHIMNNFLDEIYDTEISIISKDNNNINNFNFNKNDSCQILIKTMFLRNIFIEIINNIELFLNYELLSMEKLISINFKVIEVLNLINERKIFMMTNILNIFKIEFINIKNFYYEKKNKDIPFHIIKINKIIEQL